ncbi:unnamed protein product [Candidula unifasciata]|uniref:Glutamine amidotransferase type-2 domain-containing protein n=1 Tax=Candidula unifasciata TaxID=100452 RepID=A0A8S3YSB9_9EUPU|nr:unnamed protein product [Candidula unifasciata]
MCGICFICSMSPSAKSQIGDLMNTLFCDPLLHHRGPDVSRSHVISLAENLTGYMQGCVLHLRGHLTPQPVSDADGNAFLWNGEVFDGIQVEEHENDTEVLFGHLVKCLTEDDVLNTMQKVHGPWAFIFWQADTQKLWFGRDMYGRRSLLWHLPLSPTDHLVLTSVALGEMAYTEIPSVGIFCLDYSQVPPPSAGASQCPVLTLFPWKDCRWPGIFLPVTETDENNILAFLYPNLATCISVCIDRRSILDSWIPHINNQLPAKEASSLNTSIDLTNCASLEDMLINILNARSDLDALADELIHVLQSSVDKRVKNLPRNPRSCEHLHFQESQTLILQANVAVLFSGGLDSTVLAALADRCVPEGEPIDLLNVAFEQSVTTNLKSDMEDIASRAVDVDRFSVPDRQTGLLALSELNPKRMWNFVKINVSQAELQDLRKSHIRRLIYPLQTVLDDSIGCAVWFAARGSGVTLHNNEKFTSKARVLLCGMAADEQFAGYSRHRVTFQTKGWAGLLKEIQEEMWRISARNLGRDDRIITDHGKECRFPFLDETFTRFVSALPLCKRADLHLPRGVGDKLLLRLCAVKLGLVKTASQPKRAIQFGSRIAKLDKRKEKGSDVCDRLA